MSDDTASVRERLLRAMRLTESLVRHLGEDALALSLGDLPANAIGDQLWCVVGARESYLRALRGKAARIEEKRTV